MTAMIKRIKGMLNDESYNNDKKINCMQNLYALGK